MRSALATWDLWNKGGPFVGEDRPVGRATFEPGYYLNVAHGVVDANKSPVRWFQRAAGDQAETELPNIRSITIDRSIDSDAATCDITISNQWMKANMAPQDDLRTLGLPGMFTFDHGDSPEAVARWGHAPNEWHGVLLPNALIRTYQGYGGGTGSIEAAVGEGQLMLTGLWLVDSVRISSGGQIELKCRDMGKLLIEQQLYPPLVPAASYPLRYCRWAYKDETRQRTVADATSPGVRNLGFSNSANYAWYGSGAVHGHHPGDAFDGNDETFYLSVGNSGPEEPYATEWVEGSCGEAIDTVFVNPWAGGYTCYVSIMEDGAWVDEIGIVPYSEGGVGKYNGEFEANIPAVMSFGVPWETPTEVKLSRTYRAELVRFSFTNLAESPWGPYPYRAGARELGVRSSGAEAAKVENYTAEVKTDGNYSDFADIVKDLLLWAGWYLYNTSPAEVFGNIESTGSYSEDCFPDDVFDKRPVIDAINTIREIVGYIFWIDEEGGARFESPNWWSPGNFYTDGSHTGFIPEIDERIQLTEYTMEVSDAPARSEIIIAASDPILFPDNVTRHTPQTSGDLKGMIKPAVFAVPVVVSQAEQQTMAELIGMHMYFRQRQGNVSAWANPAIQINDQVQILERVTGDTYTHYVRGVQTSFDAEAGSYMMTLTTHWMGTSGAWAVSANPLDTRIIALWDEDGTPLTPPEPIG